jgi:hypothetical protein
MEVALRRRLDGVAEVRISQERQTAQVIFAPGAPAFAPGEFRAAVGEADVEVLRLEIEACGGLEQEDGTTWFVAGPARFIVADAAPPTPVPRCVSAELDDGVAPGRLRRLRPAGIDPG